jgi:hypothetical protein
VTPGEVRSLGKPEREPGGVKITLPEFGLTTAILITADLEMIGAFQNLSREMRRKAAQWSYDLALQQLDKVLKVEQELQKLGHGLPQTPRLIADAQERLQLTRQHWDRNLYGEAYRESQRALRPLRILMRAQWDIAVRELDTPVASQYAVSFYTLPKHWRLMNARREATVGANVLPGGDFEVEQGQVQALWTPTDVALDPVDLKAERVSRNTERNQVQPHEGKLCLRLQITPKDPASVPHALERTYLAINSPAVKLPPGTLVQISGWVHIPAPIQASVDGVLLYDSAGGEPLAVRLTEKTEWKKFTLYRRVPSSGTIGVTLALTGLGAVYFDDVRIEPLEQRVSAARE